MNTKLLTTIDNVYKQNSRQNCRTIEQCKTDHENRLKVMCESFEIEDLEGLFL